MKILKNYLKKQKIQLKQIIEDKIMFFNIKEKILRRKLIKSLEEMAEKIIKNVYLVSTVKKSVKEVNKKDRYIYAIKIAGKAKINPDIIDVMILMLEIYKTKENPEEKNYKIKIMNDLKFNPEKFTEEEIEKILENYRKKLKQK